MLRDLFISKVRVKLLQAFLGRPQEIFYVRQLVRMLGEEINAIRRELLRMEKSGAVKKEKRGNRLYYWFNQNYILFGDLLSLIHKTIGLGGSIVKNKRKLGQVKFVLLSGRFARGLPTSEGEVDLLLVGKIEMNELAKVVKAEEKILDREINYSVMNSDEFLFRKKRRDPFLLGILASSRILLLGDEEKMVSRLENA